MREVTSFSLIVTNNKRADALKLPPEVNKHIAITSIQFSLFSPSLLPLKTKDSRKHTPLSAQSGSLACDQFTYHWCWFIVGILVRGAGYCTQALWWFPRRWGWACWPACPPQAFEEAVVHQHQLQTVKPKGLHLWEMPPSVLSLLLLKQDEATCGNHSEKDKDCVFPQLGFLGFIDIWNHKGTDDMKRAG